MSNQQRIKGWISKGWINVSTPLTNRFVAVGFMGAVVATILGAAISPDHPLTAISVFARAATYILVVFATAATATYVRKLRSALDR